MSTFIDKTFPCPPCEAVQTATVAISINGERHGEVHAEIRSGLFQQALCTACEQRFEIDLPLVYLDFSKRVWVAMYPAAWEHKWRQLEREPLRDFRVNMVENAPPMVREWGKDFELRAVFGLAALREKVLLSDAGIDDAWVEVLKLDLMRSGRFGPFHPNNRPRLTSVSDQHLVFDNTKVQRGMLDNMMDNPVAWVRAHSSLTGGPYVDVGRLLTPGAP